MNDARDEYMSWAAGYAGNLAWRVAVMAAGLVFLIGFAAGMWQIIIGVLVAAYGTVQFLVMLSGMVYIWRSTVTYSDDDDRDGGYEEPVPVARANHQMAAASSSPRSDDAPDGFERVSQATMRRIEQPSPQSGRYNDGRNGTSPIQAVVHEMSAQRR